MKTLNQFEIPRRSGHCLHKGEHFIPEVEIYSLLHEDENHHLARSDYCSACWNEISSIVCSKPEIRGYWRSKIEPKQPSLESSRTLRAIKLLKELAKHPDGQAEEIFVLCLFLAHARQLALRQEFQQDEISYQLYEIVRHEEFLTIKVVNLSQIQIETIQKSLAQKLSCNEM